ncbi:MAG TPA: hypothetical protein VG370_27030 [Chloroflexota bacterium]|jgi:hypothetical protein|nr:hypothetical protein [Chloroflexota bacterium]
MLRLSSAAGRPVAPSQVWERLAAEDRVQAIRLMAQLAYQAVAERAATPTREVVDALAPRRVQDPS